MRTAAAACAETGNVNQDLLLRRLQGVLFSTRTEHIHVNSDLLPRRVQRVQFFLKGKLCK